jgi:ribosomal protein S18 acetylase RimI-like enzyme
MADLRPRIVSDVDIRPLTLGDVDAAGALLGRAFSDNPAYRAILAHLGDEARGAAVARVKHGFASAAVRYQEAHGIWHEGALAGASLVCAPGQYPHRLSAFAHHATGCLTTGWRGLRSFLRTDAYISRRHVREPHFYLFVLGVEPHAQGRGLGKALLRALNARADERGLPCYLETDKPTSVQLYESAGYVVVTEGDVPGVAGLHMWTLRRPGKSEPAVTPRGAA